MKEAHLLEAWRGVFAEGQRESLSGRQSISCYTKPSFPSQWKHFGVQTGWLGAKVAPRESLSSRIESGLLKTQGEMGWGGLPSMACAPPPRMRLRWAGERKDDVAASWPSLIGPCAPPAYNSCCSKRGQCGRHDGSLSWHQARLMDSPRAEGAHPMWCQTLVCWGTLEQWVDLVSWAKKLKDKGE